MKDAAGMVTGRARWSGLASGIPGFYWVLEPGASTGGLAGLARPGTVHALLLKEAGCRLVLNLEEPSWHGLYTVPDGVLSMAFPIRDHHTPGEDRFPDVLALCRRIHMELSRSGDGGFAAVHCAQGVGRTSTVAASYLTYLKHVAGHPAGRSAQQALDHIHDRLVTLYPHRAAVGPNGDQQRYVVQFERWVLARGTAQCGPDTGPQQAL